VPPSELPFKLKPLAREDLRAIWDYTEETWSATQADRYIREIEAAFRLLGERPRIGREMSWLGDGYRHWPVGSHTIFYRVLDDAVEIIRILHARMDPERHL